MHDKAWRTNAGIGAIRSISVWLSLAIEIGQSHDSKDEHRNP